MTTMTKESKQEKWEIEFDKAYSNMDFTERVNANYTMSIDMEKIKSFIHSLLAEARREGAREAYTMFLNVIKDAKNKFPGKKKFEMVVDVRDIEKSIKSLSSKGDK